jgi:hypothetical protein
MFLNLLRLGLALVVFEMALTAMAQGAAQHTAEPRQRPATDQAMRQDLGQVRFTLSGFIMSGFTMNFVAVFGQAFEARQMQLSAEV